MKTDRRRSKNAYQLLLNHKPAPMGGTAGYCATADIAAGYVKRLSEGGGKWSFKPVKIADSEPVIKELEPVRQYVAKPKSVSGYVKGKSCLALGLKEHDYRITLSGKTMKCGKCGSTKSTGRAAAKTVSEAGEAGKAGKAIAQKPKELAFGQVCAEFWTCEVHGIIYLDNASLEMKKAIDMHRQSCAKLFTKEILVAKVKKVR